jgi:D-alanyl-D-alanine carboxypeptidase
MSAKQSSSVLARLVTVIVILAIGLLGYLYINQRPELSLLIPGYDPLSGHKQMLDTPDWTPLTLDASQAGTLTRLTAPHYLAFDLTTGQVYYAYGSSDIISPASFTKLLSGIVAHDLVPLDTLYTVDDLALSREPTIIGMKPDEQFTLLELLRASLSTSANDAASLLASGTEKHLNLYHGAFVDLMNYQAKSLSMMSSNFQNSMGFDDSHQYTTLEDLAQLISYFVHRYPDLTRITASDRDDLLKTDTHGFYYLPNWNGLLGVYPGVYGLKIAYTGLAGYGTIVTYQDHDHHLAIILTGTDSIIERDTGALLLLNSTLQKLGVKTPNINSSHLRARYRTWSALADKIRSESALIP